MNNCIRLLIATLILSSCSSNSEEQKESQFIDPNKIELNEIVHNNLTTEQLDQIKKIHATFEEVDSISLKQTIEDFKRDLHPDNEIQIWLTMADAYQNYLNSKNSEVDLQTKTEVYKLILSRSMMSNEEAIQNSDLKILSENEAKKVLSFYKKKPDPLDIIEK